MNARLLDISRLISRVGRGPMTGIDRVEYAYFREFLDRPNSAFFLCKTGLGYIILDRDGGQAVFEKISGRIAWGKRNLLARLSAKLTSMQQDAFSDLRRLAIARSTKRQLSNTLLRILPANVEYFNVGHANLRAEVFDAVKCIPGSKKIVLVHDVIPLDHPEFASKDATDGFSKSFEVISKMADLVIYNSKETQAAAEKRFQAFGRLPDGVASHLGFDLYISNSAQRFEKEREKANFIVLGTIEPRKNHALLLDVWRQLDENLPAEDVPLLNIVGRRGWKNKRVFNTLDTEAYVKRHIKEFSDLDDEGVVEVLKGSTALLFPSKVEGFGLPLIEAAYFGIPIICSENAIYREILGDYPLYLNKDSTYHWCERILERAGLKRESNADRQHRSQTVHIPTWAEHFDRIFRVL